jgi:hypothetical protein
MVLSVHHLLRNIRLLQSDRRCVTAVEFALVGAPALLLFIIFLLMCVYQFWQIALDDAVRNVAIQIEFHNVTNSSQFLSTICSEFGAVAPCDAGNLQFAVQTSGTFSDITPYTINSSTGAFVPANTSVFPTFAQPAVGGQPVLIQVTYKPLISIPLVANVVLTGNPSPSLVSATSFVVW